MTPVQVAVIVGSLRKDSLNRKLANALQDVAPSELVLTQIPLGDLPLYNQDNDASPPAAVTKFKAAIATAHAVLFITPEHNRSFPTVIKNAIDHASRPYGQSVWRGKPAGVLGISPSPLGTATAQQHLRNILAYLDMPTLGQPEAFLQSKPETFDVAGRLHDDSMKQFLEVWMKKYAAWVAKHV